MVGVDNASKLFYFRIKNLHFYLLIIQQFRQEIKAFLSRNYVRIYCKFNETFLRFYDLICKVNAKIRIVGNVKKKARGKIYITF